MAAILSGHRIRDAIGTLFPQRRGLQFTGSATVTDNPATGRTVVDIGTTSGGSSSYASIAKWGTD